MPSIIKKLSGRGASSNKPIELLSPKPFVPQRPLTNGNINHEIHKELEAAASKDNLSPKWKVFRTANKQQKTVRAPRLRYNRTPVRQTVGGEWALRQCEVSTRVQINKSIENVARHNETLNSMRIKKCFRLGPVNTKIKTLCTLYIY